MTHIGAANSNLQHIISHIGPTIRLIPSSLQAVQDLGRYTLDSIDMVPVQKHIHESIKVDKNLIYPNYS